MRKVSSLYHLLFNNMVLDEDKERIIKSAFKTLLTETEIKILILRYGLDNSKPLNLEETGNQLGYKEEEIRQMEVKALKKLLHYVRCKEKEVIYK